MDKAKGSQHISITHEFIILPCVCCYGHLFPPSSPEVITTTFDFASTYSNICCDYTYTLFLTEKHMYVWWPGLIVNSANIESPEKSIRIEDWLACGWLVGMIVRNYFLPWGNQEWISTPWCVGTVSRVWVLGCLRLEKEIWVLPIYTFIYFYF